jgi:UDP-3-O-[3-hydroxymyristoyl] glucosamine N-acyltransferase
MLSATEQTLTIGPKCSIGAHATIYYGVEIGEGTLIGDGASIREGARIGCRCIVSRCVTLNYDVRVGDDVNNGQHPHHRRVRHRGRGICVGDGRYHKRQQSPPRSFEIPDV